MYSLSSRGTLLKHIYIYVAQVISRRSDINVKTHKDVKSVALIFKTVLMALFRRCDVWVQRETL